MVELTREIRFSLIAPKRLAEQSGRAIANSWAGWPNPGTILAPYLQLQCTLVGNVDRETGYVCNVKQVDRLLRDHVVTGWITEDNANATEAIELIRFAWQTCESRMPKNTKLKRMTLKATPFLRYSIYDRDKMMVQLSQQFEFSASHRLHCSDMSEQENRDLFGKCNNPKGHGHNYVLDLTFDPKKGPVDLAEIESTVKQKVIDPFDHKYLNDEVEEFESLNPSVENIAITIWNRLHDQFESADLSNVRVYETPKTWADFAG